MQYRVKDIRDIFINKYKRAAQYPDNIEEDGNLEILSASFIADEPVIFGVPNEKYQEAELNWYDSMKLNLDKLEEFYGKVPVIWKRNAANTRGDINSNYGYLVYHLLNGAQYDNVYQELKRNPQSRRATMIYTHPNMHEKHREHGKNDFVCTNAVTYYNKRGKLHAVVQMRSNDAVFGYINDLYWQDRVLDRLRIDLELEKGSILWQAQSLHVYPRHFHHIEKLIKPTDYPVEDIGAHDG